MARTTLEHRPAQLRISIWQPLCGGFRQQQPAGLHLDVSSAPRTSHQQDRERRIVARDRPPGSGPQQLDVPRPGLGCRDQAHRAGAAREVRWAQGRCLSGKKLQPFAPRSAAERLKEISKGGPCVEACSCSLPLSVESSSRPCSGSCGSIWFGRGLDRSHHAPEVCAVLSSARWPAACPRCRCFHARPIDSVA